MPAAPDKSSPPSPSTRGRFSAWRLLKWTIGIFVGFLVALIVLTQILLWTDIPRRVAQRELSNALGVVTRIERVDIAWNGATEMSNVTLQLPLAAEPFARIDRIDVGHTALPLLVFEQNVQSVEARGVQIQVMEETGGRWNIERFLGGVRRKPASPGTAREPPRVPKIRVTDGTIVVHRGERSATIAPVLLEITDAPGSVEKHINLKVGENAVSGRIALLEDMAHELHVDLRNIPDKVKTLLELPANENIQAKFDWRGRRTENGLAGVLEIPNAQFAQFTAGGALDIRASVAERTGEAEQPPSVTIQPRDVSIRQSSAATQPAQNLMINAGTVTIAGAALQIDHVRGSLNNGSFAANGTANLNSLQSDIQVAWREIARNEARASGTAQLRTSRLLAGVLSGKAHVEMNVRVPSGEFSSQLTFDGEFDSLEAFSGQLQTEPFRWRSTNGRSFVVPALAGRIESRGQVSQLVSIHPVDPTRGNIRGIGAFDRSRNFWWLWIEGKEIVPQRLGVNAANSAAGSLQYDVTTRTTDLNLNVSGTLERLDLEQFFIRQGTAEFFASGRYIANDPEPIHLYTWGAYRMEPDPTQPDRLRGLETNAQITGTLDPRSLKITGTLDANDLVLRARDFGDVSFEIEGQVADRHAFLRSRELEFLDGHWALQGDWTAWSEEPPRVTVLWRELSAERLGGLLGVPGISGTLATGSAEFLLHGRRIEDVQMSAVASGSDLAYRQFEIDQLDLKATLANGRISAQSTLKELAGQIDATAEFPVRNFDAIDVKAKLNKWPIPPLEVEGKFAGLRAWLTGAVSFRYPKAQQPSGQASISGTVTRGDANEPVGDLQFQTEVKNGLAELKQVTLHAFDGSISGVGTIDFEKLSSSNIDFKFSSLEPSSLAWLAKPMADVAGNVSGELSVSPAKGERPLGPMQLQLIARSENGAYKGIALDSVDIVAFGDFRSREEFRLVTDQATILAAGGTVRPFVRISQAPAQGLTQLLTAQFESLEIGSIVNAIDPDGTPVNGLASGNVRLYGITTDLKTLAGEANMRLEQSDLANFGPVAFLYDAMRIGPRSSTPTGSGRLGLRLEQSTLSLLYANYFNRGVHIEAVGEVKNFDRVPDSPINITLVGSAQPLRDIELPFLADADKVIEILQTAVTTVQASGTLKEPKARLAGLEEIGQTLDKLLRGNKSDAVREQK